MGLLDLFDKKKEKSVKRPTTKKSTAANTYRNIDKIIRDSDKAIAEMQRADVVFEKDGNLQKRIKVYEKHLLKEPQWNSFNFNMSLAQMYVKAGRNNDAWTYLNQMYLWATNPNVIGGDASKVRLEQFRILKSEKKYEDALVMLVSSYVIKAYELKETYFNKGKFKKDAKTTLKAIGFDESESEVFIDDLEHIIMTKRIREATVRKYCTEHIERIGRN